MSDQDPGITRHRRGRGFSYRAPDGTTIARGRERERIEALAVPPAYENVWICSRPDGHLQATGRDARRRKQYRYHPKWSEVQAENKFEFLAHFGEMVPRIRRRIDRDLQAHSGDEVFALAAAVLLIDRASLRVGHPANVRENGSYGALTLRQRHLSLDDDKIHLRFTAKGGAKVRKTITDRKLLRLLHKVNDIPGATLLTWLDDDGAPQTISSQKLNSYLADAAGSEQATAKTFRTWAGTLAAFECAAQGGATITAMAQAAADRLHNTPTVARNSYIHPAVIDLADIKLDDIEHVTEARSQVSGLFVAEQRMLPLLQTR
ncbi:MAG: DNA topoisomerase IB [Pseudomonadota bacterium]